MKHLIPMTLLALLVSCQLPWQTNGTKPTTSSVSLRFAPPNEGRTLLADWAAQITGYPFTLLNTTTSEDFSDPSNTSANPSIAGLTAGDYTLNVAAKNGAQTILSSLPVSFTVPDDIASPIPVVLVPSLTGTGTYTYRVRFPDDVVRVTGTLLNTDYSDGPGVTFDLVTAEFTFVADGVFEATMTDTVDAGNYRLRLDFYRLQDDGTTEVAVRRSLVSVNVWASVLSDRVVDFETDSSFQVLSVEDFASTNPAPQDLGLTLQGASPSVSFDGSQTTYSLDFGPGSTELTLFPTWTMPGQRLTYSLDGAANQDLPWNASTVISANLVGLDTHTLEVTSWATDGQSSRTYTYTLNRRSSASVSFTTATFQTLDFGVPAYALEEGASLTLTPAPGPLQTGAATDWEWVVDDVELTTAAGLSSWAFEAAVTGDEHGLAVGFHTLSLGVTYGGVRYSGTISITVNPTVADPEVQ